MRCVVWFYPVRGGLIIRQSHLEMCIYFYPVDVNLFHSVGIAVVCLLIDWLSCDG